MWNSDDFECYDDDISPKCDECGKGDYHKPEGESWMCEDCQSEALKIECVQCNEKLTAEELVVDLCAICAAERAE